MNGKMKKELSILKAQKTKLLNKKCETPEEFEMVQEKLNNIEAEMMFIKNDKHIPHID